jgi:hypothetical protein
VNYKSGGRHWVLNSGCIQHMTENSECDMITFGDNSKGKVKGLGKITISNNLSILNVLLVESLSIIYYLLINYVILVLYANSLLRMLS